jgi:hypothetical protein
MPNPRDESAPMKLEVFKALWGMTGPLAEQMDRIAEAGYDGVEAWIADGLPSPANLVSLAEAHGLKWIVATAVPDVDHLDSMLSRLADYGPVKINLQSGRDSMTREEGSRYFERALKVESLIGIPVTHETHRGKLLFTPWDAAYYLRAFDTLHINADYSHWVNVCERLPDDQAEALALANERVRHIHGRVGYEEGPQVPDPAAPEYASQLAWHERQWLEVWNHRESAGAADFTFTPEYGPPNYLHTLPHTNVPVADLWRICLWGKDRARQLFG